MGPDMVLERALDRVEKSLGKPRRTSRRSVRLLKNCSNDYKEITQYGIL